MSLTLVQMKGLLHEIKSRLEGADFDGCIAAGDRKFILHFKNQESLLICFQEPFLRFHLTKHHWKNHPSSFSRSLTQSLHLWRLDKCDLLQDDRILLLVFTKSGESQSLICEFIPKKANCYLTDSQEQIIASLNPISNASYIPPQMSSKQPNATENILSSLETESIYLDLELQAEFDKKKHQAETQLKSQLRQNLKAKDKFSQELDAALGWEKVQHEATLLQANLYKIMKGMTKICVHDWLKENAETEILLDPTLSPAEEIAKRFQKCKKLKRAIEPLKRQLEQASKNIGKVSNLLDQLGQITSEQDLKIFCQRSYLPVFKEEVPKHALPTPALPFREFFSEAGLQIWVGKSAKDNDKLTFTHANGSDYWLHARDVPGSHVVLHLGKQKEPDEESLKDAIQAALFYSKACKNQEGEVCITQCKYVSRFGKDQPGKVQISQHRTVYAKMDQERLKKLKERKKG